MKRKELKDYIRTEIINELSEAGTYAGNKAIDDMKKDPDYNTLSSPTKIDSEKKLKSGGSVTIGESDLDEMARHRKTIRVGNQEKFDEALDLYGTNTIEGKILQMIQDAGENGTTQEDMATALNTSTSVLNPRIKEFETANVFNRSDKNIDTLDVDLPDDEEIEEPEMEEPEEEESEEPETEKEDDFPIEFEPSTADIKSTEKEFGGEYGKKLSPEDEEKYQKIRSGIEKKIKRLADMSSSERAKSLDLQQLKALINKEDIKKLFKDKGVSLKDLVGDIIG